MLPVIGICSCFSLAKDPQRQFSTSAEIHYIQKDYIEFVRIGGGLPVILPIIEDPDEIENITSFIDGLILTGGMNDVDPSLYGEENSNSADVSKERDKCEIDLYQSMRKIDKAIIGVCRGMQIMNAVLGGSIYQDIDTHLENPLPHYLDENKKERFHNIQFPEESVLTDIFGKDEIRVNSSHHQSVKNLGKDAVVIAKSSDNVIEAIQIPEEYCNIGVQWHPERMRYDENMVNLAKWFINRAVKK